jgi:predicted O-linked N-acetylglucosamine transferase (SPINDLY family)
MPDIPKERLLFSIATSHHEHMQAYQQADLILDPFPHTGGVVCLEQLYMGVPMVTLYGTQASGRTSSSVLTQMGKTDWIAKTTEDYIEKAVAMVQDLPSLGKIRKTLSAEFLASPVVNGYKEAVEAAYRTMWQTWCEKPKDS